MATTAAQAPAADKKHAFKENSKKLEELKKLQTAVRTGGKGSVRRKKVFHGAGASDDAKVQQQLKRLNLTPINDVDLVSFVMDDNTVMEFNKPKVSMSGQFGCISVKGKFEKKSADEALSSILSSNNLADLKKLAEQIQQSTKEGEKKADEVPKVESFETVS